MSHVRKGYGAFDGIRWEIVVIDRFMELRCEPSCNISPKRGGLLLRESRGALLRFHHPEHVVPDFRTRG
jgi:hypothetical protein